jgi:hypothetical protein
LRLAGVQEANRVDIHEVYFIQIQSYPWVTTLDLSAQSVEVLRSKFTAQLNPYPVFPINSINSQRHHCPVRTHDYECKNEAIRICLRNLDLEPPSILSFEDFLIGREKGLDHGFPPESISQF